MTGRRGRQSARRPGAATGRWDARPASQLALTAPLLTRKNMRYRLHLEQKVLPGVMEPSTADLGVLLNARLIVATPIRDGGRHV